MVDIGPILPMIEKLEAPIFLMASETKNEGINVDKIAIIKPSRYT